MAKTNKDKIIFPDHIQKKVEKFREKRLKEERLKKQREKEKAESDRQVKIDRLKSGLDYAKKVFEWSESFRKSNVGQELMRVSYTSTVYRSIFFFDDHMANIDWVGLLVDSKGVCIDEGGRYSSLFRIVVSTPKELAESVDTRVLKRVCEWLDNGKVWDCIERRFLNIVLK